MISYAQNLEDVLLARVFSDQPIGFYVDIGANHPVKLSITKHFYDLGWNGINVEPGKIFEELQAARPRDINLNVAVSNATGQRTFYEYPVGHALSSFNPSLPPVEAHWLEGRIERVVQTMTLRDIFAAHPLREIDFMNVDVEGHQREVLEGNDWQKWRPRVILAEATDPSQHAVFNQDSWEAHLLSSGYKAVLFDGLNRFYLRDEDAHLAERFRAPANVLDNFVSAEVMLLRQEVRRQKVSTEKTAAKLQSTRAELKRLRATLGQLQAEKLLETRDKTTAFKKLQECREELRSLQRAFHHQAEAASADTARLLHRLKERQLELNELKRNCGPHSLEFGLKIARAIHKVAELPKRFKKRKRAA